IPAPVTSRLRVACPERGNGMVRLAARVRGGSGGTSWNSRRNSGPKLAPAPSTDGGNVNGSEEAVGPARSGPRGGRLVPRKRAGAGVWGMVVGRAESAAGPGLRARGRPAAAPAAAASTRRASRTTRRRLLTTGSMVGALGGAGRRAEVA